MLLLIYMYELCQYDVLFLPLVPRAQFLAIEVVRNRLGLNSMHLTKGSS